MRKLPYGKQSISDEDIRAVVDTLKSDFLTTGPRVKEFEDAFAQRVGAKYAVAVSNGTAALHLACLAAGLKPGEELITTPLTFVASANCALYCGARPVFADVCEKDGLIDPKEIRKKVSPLTKVVLPVHWTGKPCNMKEIKHIANENGLLVIEDACHALGSEYESTVIGDCAYSDMCVFSFHPVKHITSAEGGMITTNSRDLHEKLLLLRNHGITRDSAKLHSKEPWMNEMQTLGFNYRLSDLQSALGLSQLKRVDEFVKRRCEIAGLYRNLLPRSWLFEEVEELSSAYHLFVVKVPDREGVFRRLRERDILPQVHYIPVYYHPYYTDLGYRKGLCPVAERIYEQILSLPLFVGLSDEEVEYVSKVLKDVVPEEPKD